MTLVVLIILLMLAPSIIAEVKRDTARNGSYRTRRDARRAARYWAARRDELLDRYDL